MAKHGTLPEYLYQCHLEVGDKVNLNFGVDEDEQKLVTLTKASQNLIKVVMKKLKSVQMTTIPRASKMKTAYKRIQLGTSTSKTAYN